MEKKQNREGRRREDGVTVDLNSTIPESGGQGQEHPLIQWVKGNVQTISLPVMLFSRDELEDIEPRYENLKKLWARDRLLKRPPVCRFTFGRVLSTLCKIRSLGGVKIYPLRPGGKARQIDLTITLVRYVPLKLVEADTRKPVRESLQYTVGRGERSYEMLAVRLYGQGAALWGDRLRKRNQDQAFAAGIGSEVKIPSSNIVLKEKVQPEFHVFKRGDATAEARVREMFVARNALTAVKQRR